LQQKDGAGSSMEREKKNAYLQKQKASIVKKKNICRFCCFLKKWRISDKF
jgi:hypothetical protein